MDKTFFGTQIFLNRPFVGFKKYIFWTANLVFPKNFGLRSFSFWESSSFSNHLTADTILAPKLALEKVSFS